MTAHGRAAARLQDGIARVLIAAVGACCMVMPTKALALVSDHIEQHTVSIITRQALSDNSQHRLSSEFHATADVALPLAAAVVLLGLTAAALRHHRRSSQRARV